MSNTHNINGFIITAAHEQSRLANVLMLQKQLPTMQIMEAIYPSRQKIPFINQLICKSEERTGRALNLGEIGVLLSNRKIWQTIVQSEALETASFLIVESDSVINELNLLQNNFQQLTSQYDLFFWGGWFGHIKLLHSSQKKISPTYSYGTPLINTICCGYGYSVNKKTARYLLQQTKQIAYPVDEFKKYIPSGKLTIGAIVPEIISQAEGESTIGHEGLSPFIEKIWFLILDIRNAIICFFN